MSDFERLGIEPTKDKKKIKKAYVKSARRHRPDRDPIAFELLNRAYKSALKYAEGEADTSWDAYAYEWNEPQEQAQTELVKDEEINEEISVAANIFSTLCVSKEKNIEVWEEFFRSDKFKKLKENLSFLQNITKDMSKFDGVSEAVW